VTYGFTIERLAQIVSGAEFTSSDLQVLDCEESWQRAAKHGVAELLAARLAAMRTLDRSVDERVIDITRRQVAMDMALEAQLRRCLARLRAADVASVLMKGVQLAYSHYDRPDLRPRLDVDLVIAAGQRAQAHDVLVRDGYVPDVQASADLVLHQHTYVKHLDHGLPHVIDLHWRVANPEIFGGVLTFAEMAQDAVVIGALGDDARGLSPVHALLVACIHRVAHHRGAERLIWLLDIHLLASRLEEGEWRAFVDLAIDREVAAVCADGLNRTRQLFGTPVPVLCERLTDAAGRGHSEITARYLTPGRVLTAVVDDLRSLPTWGHRWRLVKDYAFPPVRYMREVYAPSSGSPLPWLYLRRMVFGARRWLVHS
jgi:putative nucleotidyltransferase-like protein